MMFRKALWVLAGLYPMLSVALVWLIGPSMIDRIIASPPEKYGAVSDFLLTYWWLIFVVTFSLHVVFFAIHPFFNRHLNARLSKIGWALVNFFTWPFGTVFYVFLTGRKTVTEAHVASKA